MQQDIHYYGIGFIARAAGFPKKSSLKVAYASQYVDDSTESVAIRIGEGTFDTVRTAHLGPEAWTNHVHKSVYVPFHFLPEKPFTRLTDSYVTVPESELADLVIQRALEEQEERDRLIAIGIAMHTFADTFAHQGFTGRDDVENQVERLERMEDGEWNSADFWNLLGHVLRGVGHLLADSYPDYPWMKFRYYTPASRKRVNRSNSETFERALKAMYERLSAMPDATDEKIPWAQIVETIRNIISIEEEELVPRIYGWIVLYGDTFRDIRGYRNIQGYRYMPLQWRERAVKPVGNFTVAWDGLDPEELERQKYEPKAGFLTSDWVSYHRMALKQRHFVQQRLL